jgi:hypothetical protein
MKHGKACLQRGNSVARRLDDHLLFRFALNGAAPPVD